MVLILVCTISALALGVAGAQAAQTHRFQFGINARDVPVVASGTADLDEATGTGDTHPTSNFEYTITNVSTSSGAFAVGMTLAGEGLQPGTRIDAIEPGSLTINKAAFGQSHTAVRFAAGSVTDLVTSAGTFEPGQEISGSGFSPGTTITGIEGSTLLTSEPVTSTATDDEITASEVSLAPHAVAVDNSGGANNGDVYFTDSSAVERYGPSGDFLSRITGAELPDGSFKEPTGLAIDESDGDFYVLDGQAEAIDKFDSSAKLATSFAAGGQLNGASTPQHTLGDPTAIATDPSTGDLYVVGSNSGLVDVFSSNGEYQRQFTVSSRIVGAAIDSEGRLFLAGQNGTYVYDAGSGLPDPAYGQGTGLLDISEAQGVAVDPADDDVYVVDRNNHSPHNERVVQYDSAGRRLGEFGNSVLENTDPRGVAIGDVGAHIYVVEIESPREIAVFDRSVVPLPTATTTEATELAATSATLNGTVAPEGAPVTECFFEYGETEDYGQLSPCEPAASAIGSGTEPVAVHVDVAGLASGTPYHFRLVAANENGSEHGADQLFGEPPHIEATSVASVTSDAAELQAGIDPGGVAATYHFEYLTQGAYRADGESFSGPEPATSVPVLDDVIASVRGDQPVSQLISGLTPETTYYFRVVAANSAAPAGVAGPIRRLVTHSTAVQTGLPDARAYELVSPSTKSTGGDIFDFDRISADDREFGHHYAIQATEDGGAITYLGEDFFEPIGADPGEPDQYTSVRTAAGWSTKNTTGESTEEAFTPLAPPPVPPAPLLPPSATAAAKVREVSPDGSIVYFTDTGRLTPDSTAAPGEPDLYRYEVDGGGLSDLSVDPNSGEHADVQGVLGAGGNGTEAGSYVYFVADGSLAPGAPRGDCEPLANGNTGGTACDLYLSHGGAITFLASLTADDEASIGGIGSFEGRKHEVHDWGDLSDRTAEVSPNGRYLAFAALDALTSEPAVGPQVYRFDAADESLVCASCNPDGSTSPSAFILFPAGSGGVRQHYIADDGRLFFNDTGPLVAGDVNGADDVYEYEDSGTGSCDRAGGCRFLISGGAGAGESLLAAVSAEGNDVFFTTSQELTSEDHDESVDLYDARIDGRTPPEPAIPCQTGEACHGPAPSALGGPTAGTAGFHGSGNPVGKICKRGSVKKHGKCVKRSRRHKPKPHMRTHHRGNHGKSQQRARHKGGGAK